MKNKIIILSVLVVLAIVGIALISQAAQEPQVRKIVVFKSGVLNEPAKEALVKKFGGTKIKNLDLIDGKAVFLPPRSAGVLAKQAGVLRIDDDVEVFALAKSQAQPAEVLPWGVNRIDADLVWGLTTGQSVKVAIIDTGIDIKHPDLSANIKGGMSAVGYTQSFNDDNGHGTHVAGIAAAIDNEIGVIGIGPKISLYAVKVLDRRGSGYLSDVIEGLDWAVQNGMQVVNMSLGTTVNVQSFMEAVQKVNQAGIVQVAAAGNTGSAVTYPAAYLEVIAVSATDSSDNLASFSSRGPEVDLSAPGVSIYSTYKGGSYKTLNGTSMAAPHVAGTAALVLTTAVAGWDLDGNGIWSPAEVQNKLEKTAEDLGILGRDNFFGSGLVDAEKAALQ